MLTITFAFAAALLLWASLSVRLGNLENYLKLSRKLNWLEVGLFLLATGCWLASLKASDAEVEQKLLSLEARIRAAEVRQKVSDTPARWHRE